jgi:26S proteasome regulatory subunit N1
LICARTIYKKYGKLVEAMTLSIRLDSMEFIEEDFADAKDEYAQLFIVANVRALRKQLAFLLARNQIWFNPGPDESNEIDDCLRNLSLSNHFIHLATELSVKDPKSPEDIYKSHLENTRPGLTGGVDSAKMNLASTFVSGLVNAGMKEDKLGMTGKKYEKDGETVFETGGNWIWKNKDMGMLSATASLGWLNLWDAEDSINTIDAFVYADDPNIQVP